LDAYINSLSRGSLPTCPICQSTRESRMLSDLRDRKIVSYLRPDIVLYGEDHRGADDITDILKQDVRAMDLLLVAGTSIRVDGVKNMVQTCIQSLGRRFGKKKAPFISSIYVNLDMTTSQQSSYPFDTWLKGDCQLFATMVLEAMKKDVGPTKTQVKEDEKVGGREAFNPVMTYVDRRLDLRPLSRYY
jgi:NAD-dependent SIR2 family protein deacetylase